MNSLKRHEGYLLIDHRAGDGTDAVPGGSKLEAATITCSHCQRVVVLNPLRTRPRNFCPKCDHYICDQCEGARVAAGGECRPFKQIVDEMLEQAARAEQSNARGIIQLP